MQEKKIIEIIDTLRPFLLSDGGNIEFVKYENNRLTINSCLLFLSRMFYPTFYFDIYENVLQGKEKEKSLLKVISRINEYEYLLKQIYLYLRSIMNVPEIEWLDNLR